MEKTFLQTLSVQAQNLLPQHGLSQFAGYLANCEKPWLKNALIRHFMKNYSVNLNEAEMPTPEDYLSFNHFFTRALKPGARTLTENERAIASPVDGCFAEVGTITQGQLVQAKGMNYSLDSLFANRPEAADFLDGQYATIYLAPHNYHRVHMPVSGRLTSTIYVPGRLFSVNRMTTDLIPNLYARNERLITLFETDIGPMAVIFVGAIIVGSIQTVWMPGPIRAKQLVVETENKNIMLKKGDELGRFSLGSTVILLFGRDKLAWLPQAHPGFEVQLHESIGEIK